jgi:predicted DNA-binding transcriptional regulator AlpA
MKMIPPDRLLPDKGIGFSNAYRIELENQNKFPKRIKLGERKYAYSESEIDRWIEQRAALREAAKPTPAPVDSAA